MDYESITNSCQQQGFEVVKGEVVKGLFSAGELEEIHRELQHDLAGQLAEPEPRGPSPHDDGPC